MSEKIVLAMETMGLNDVVIGLEATSIYGDSLVYALREDKAMVVALELAISLSWAMPQHFRNR